MICHHRQGIYFFPYVPENSFLRFIYDLDCDNVCFLRLFPFLVVSLVVYIFLFFFFFCSRSIKIIYFRFALPIPFLSAPIGILLSFECDLSFKLSYYFHNACHSIFFYTFLNLHFQHHPRCPSVPEICFQSNNLIFVFSLYNSFLRIDLLLSAWKSLVHSIIHIYNVNKSNIYNVGAKCTCTACAPSSISASFLSEECVHYFHSGLFRKVS